MAYTCIAVEPRDHVGLIRLDRPKALNALNAQLMSELALVRHGWMMLLVFAGLASAVFGAQESISQRGVSRRYRFLLVAAALCFLTSGIFPLGATSVIHISAIAAAFVLTVLAMYLFPTSAGRASVETQIRNHR